jgi:hypothetical protein
LSSTIKKSQKESIPFKIPNELPKRKECAHHNLISVLKLFRRVPYDPNAFKGDFESKLKYWTISEKCNRVLETESYRDGSAIFEDIEKRESIWLGDKAFFWVSWALFEEQFGHYVLAAALFEKAIKNKAKVQHRYFPSSPFPFLFSSLLPCLLTSFSSH